MVERQPHSATSVISAVRARRNFGWLLQEACHRGQRFTVEQDGKPMAVVVGIEEWERIAEILSGLNHPNYPTQMEEMRGIELVESLTWDKLRTALAEASHGL